MLFTLLFVLTQSYIKTIIRYTLRFISNNEVREHLLKMHRFPKQVSIQERYQKRLNRINKRNRFI